MSLSSSMTEGSSSLCPSVPATFQSGSSASERVCLPQSECWDARHDRAKRAAKPAPELAFEKRAWLGDKLSLEDLLLRFHGDVEAPVEAAAACLASEEADGDLAQAAEALCEQVHEFTSTGLRAAAALQLAREEALPAALRRLKARPDLVTREQALLDLRSVQALLCKLSTASSDALESYACLQDRAAYLLACTEVVSDGRAMDGESGDRLAHLARAMAHCRRAEAVLRQGSQASEALLAAGAEVARAAELVDQTRKMCKSVDNATYSSFPFFECLGTTLHACLTSLTSVAVW